MKKFKFMIAFAVVALTAVAEMNAQVGIEAGYLNSGYSSKNKDSKDVTKTDPMNGFYVGVTDDIRLVAGLSVQPGLYYSFGASSDSEEVAGIKFTASSSDHNLNVPVDFKYTFSILPILDVYVFAGPTFTLGLASKYSADLSGELLGNKIEGNVSYDYYTGKIKSDNLTEEQQNAVNSQMPQSRMSRFDIMLGGGVGVNLFKFLTVKGGFDYGLLNRYKGDLANNATLTRNQFYVSVGFRF